jgi:hypothetical protein
LKVSGAKRLLRVLMLWCILCLPFTVHAQNGEEDPGKEEELPVEVGVERIHTRIDPEIELSVPSGRLHLFFDENFRTPHTRFGLDYEFLDNAIDVSLRFSRPIGRLDPGVRFYDGFDFENYFSPAFVKGDVVLLPKEEYVQRDRGGGTRRTASAPSATFCAQQTWST